jgi:release factor glutamine methyltransferase
MTIREALNEGSSSLKSVGIDTPSLDASLLLAQVLQISRAQLIAAGPDPLPETSHTVFQRLLERRLAGESIAYILGRKEFMGLDFKVSPAVLVPRPDTEILVETSLKKIEESRENTKLRFGEVQKGRRPCSVLDLCTGSGAIAVSLKHEMPELEVWASDISAEALDIARANAARLLPQDHIRSPPIHFIQSDLFDALAPPSPSTPRFSLITSNPPSIPSAEIERLAPEIRREPRLALDGGDDGLDIITRIITGAPDFLCPGGSLLLEAEPGQMDSIRILLETGGFNGIQTYRDLPGRERVISGAKPWEDKNG